MSPRRRRPQARIIRTGWSEADDGPLQWTGPEEACGRWGYGQQGHTGGWGAGAHGPTGGQQTGAQDTSPASGPDPQEDRPAGTDRRAARTRRRVLAITGVIALVLGVVVLLPGLLFGSGGPEKTAREFLDALVAGDAETARPFIEDADDASSAALTDQIYRAATGRITGYEIDSVETGQGTATVKVTLDNGREQQQSTLTLHSGASGPFSPVTWRLDPVPLTEAELRIPVGTTEVRLNGVPLSIAELDQAIDGHGEPQVVLQLLPGTYELTLPERGDLLDPVPTMVTAPPVLTARRPTTDMVMYDLAPEGLQEVRDEIARRLADCSVDPATMYEECRLALPTLSLLVQDDAADVPVADNDGEEDAPVELPGSPWEDESGDTAGLYALAEGTIEITEQPRLEVNRWMLGVFQVHGAGTLEFTPAPRPDGTQDPPTTLPFLVDAIVAPDTEGALHTTLFSPMDGLTLTTCIDTATGATYVGVHDSHGVGSC